MAMSISIASVVDLVYKSRVVGPSNDSYLGPLLLTWFNFNPSMDK